MATYTYTGVLTDFGESPFPGAHPRLWVEAKEPAFGANGPLAVRRIPIPVAPSGAFSVDLVPSSATIPATRYLLRVEWLHVDDTLAGWSPWEFTALVGGGNIATMGAGLAQWAIIYGYGPPPSTLNYGVYLDISGVNPVLYLPEGVVI